MMDFSSPESRSLKERLANMDPGQRKRLLSRLKNGSGLETEADGSAAIPVAKPLYAVQQTNHFLGQIEVRYFAASNTQERMWFLHEFSDQRPVYSSPMAFRLSGFIEVSKLEAAFEMIVNRHDSLRTTFCIEEEQILQCVSSQGAFLLEEIDIEAKSATESELNALIHKLACKPFDLVAGPLLRATLIRLDAKNHFLVVVIHHIISDGWSRANLLKELSDCYNAFVEGENPDVPELPIQVSDYSAWMELQLETPSFKKHWDYWKEKLGGDPDPLDLPLDFPRPSHFSTQGNECVRPFDSKLAERLKQRARENGATFFMILLAAYKTLLHRYSGQKDLIVGIAIANRNRKEIEDLIGCFINSLAMRTDFSGDPTFGEALARVRDTAVEAFAHHEVPFERVLNELVLRRDPSRNPLFQTTFALQDFAKVELALTNITSSEIPVSTHTSKVELSLVVEPKEAGWVTRVEYCTDLFSRERIERLLGHWYCLLEAIAENPNRSISSIPLLTAAEQAAEREWNDTERNYRVENSIQEVFEHQAGKTPNVPAICFKGRELTYGEVNKRANRLAHFLRQTGVESETLVGLCLERSADMLIALLGILKAGGAYVPLDPQAPDQRLLTLITDAGIQHLVTDTRSVLGADSESLKRVSMDESDSWSHFSSENPATGGRPSHLAYVLFTSGSTGAPKGVLVEHRQLVNYTHAVAEACVLGAGSYAMLQPLTVDSTQTVIFPAWFAGGTIHVIPWELALDASKLARYFKENTIDYLKIAPSHLSALLKVDRTGDLIPGKRLMLGGESLPWSLVKDIKSFKPRCRLFNHYGPTETTVGVITGEVDLLGPEIDEDHGKIPLGKPIGNVSVYILNSGGTPQPVGIPGEIHIGGAAVTRGYLNQRELTDSVFLKDLFSDSIHARMYRTGDFGCRRSDGRIAFLGRRDDQVKIRGFRIELGEIETLLSRHPAVSEQAVLVAPDKRDQPSLVAFVVMRSGSSVSTQDLKHYLVSRLPSAMVPSQIIALNSIPRTAQGKTDRKNLQKRALIQDSVGTTNQDIEIKPGVRKLCEIIASTLRRKQIDPQENFFELGGNSLSATLVLARIKKEFQVEMLMREFFDNPTASGLLNLLESKRPGASRPSKVRKPTKPNFSCFVIGDSRMVIRIVEVLQERGEKILGISSTCREVLNWAASHGIATAGARDDPKVFFESEPFDYLFSVTNSRILSKEILRLPKFGAWNFHNGPLPRYAGLNASAWAILNGERDYGVTWHEMTAGIDEGPVLKQTPVEISESDTFVSVSLDCVESGVSAFQDLLEELKAGTLQRTEQNLGLRTYYSKWDRPTPGCVIDWTQSAVEVDRLWRALQFGRFFNFMGTPKLWVDGSFFIVGDLSVLDQSEPRPGGTVIKCDEEGLVIATATHPILIKELYTIDGKKLSIKELGVMTGLQAAEVVPQFKAADKEQVLRTDRLAIRFDAFWRNQLLNRAPVSIYPLFSSKGARESRERAWVNIRLGCAALNWASQWESPLTRREVILTAWAAYMGRLTGRQSFAVEYSPQFVLEKYLSHCSLLACHLPCCFDFQLNRPFSVLLESMQNHLKAIRKNPVYGRDLVFREPLLCKRPDFQKLHKLPVGVVEVEDFNDYTAAVEHECVLILPEKGEEVRLYYNPDLFSEEGASKILLYFDAFLQGISENPDCPIDGISLLKSAEEDWVKLSVGPEISYPRDATIHRLFEDAVNKHAHAIAVTQGEQRITYNQLNTHANRLAHQLINAGVQPNGLVGVYLDQSIEQIIALLGILKAGAGYLPLDPLYPSARLKLMIEDSDLGWIVSKRELADFVSTEKAKVFLVESSASYETSEEVRNPQIEVSANDLAYTIYTSGTTGDSKGVLIEHRSLVNYVCSAIRYYELTSADRVLQVSSINFDASAEEIYCALISGANLVLRTEETLSTQAHFLSWCSRNEITVMPLPTALWHEMVSALDSENIPFPSSVRLVVIGGEQARASSFSSWQTLVGHGVRLVNSYGPTETTIAVTWCDLTHYQSQPGLHLELPIGKPIPNTQTYVLDSNLKPVPRGVVGELFIGGDGLARGYLNDATLTSQRFVANPFVPGSAARMYRTGDQVRVNQTDDLVFVGRGDRQVKIRGFRIEPGEIEKHLNTQALVRESVVIVSEEESGNKILIGYVVPKNSGEVPTSLGLRDHLKQLLPDYMIPAIFVILEKLPLTPNLKVDHKALPSPEVDRRLTYKPRILPRTPAETFLATIWSGLLKLDPIGVEDDFFALGGHSLMASQMLSRIRQKLDTKISLKTIFDYPTIGELAPHLPEIPSCVQNGIESSGEVVEMADKQSLLSFSQQRLWFLDQFKGSSSEYNLARAMVFTGDLNREALEKSINTIVARHQSLRTRFDEANNQPVQIVEKKLEIKIHFRDLRGIEEAERQRILPGILLEERGRAFNLRELPLLRMQLVALEDKKHILNYVFHHIVFDGWSLGVFHDELSKLYSAFDEGREDPLEPLTFQYPDYALQQRELLQGEYLENQINFWKHYLEGFSNLALPTDKPRPRRQTYVGASHKFGFPAKLCGRIQEFNSREKVTPFMSLLAAFQVLLSRYSGQKDILTGIPIANRRGNELEPLIGFFVNTLVMRTKLSDQACFRDLVIQVRNSILNAFQHQDFPFEKLVEEINPKRDVSKHPLFQVLFALQNASMAPPDLKGLEIKDYPLSTATTHFDLALDVFPQGETWTGCFTYNTDLFDQETIVRMTAHYLRLVETLIENPDAPVFEFPLLTREELENTTREWNQTFEAYDRDLCVHQLFEAQAAYDPDKEAARYENDSISYGQLNERANQLAYKLKSLGVSGNEPVGIYLDRSLEMLVGVLAILKSGGACLPLDPGYPKNRISAILADARPMATLSNHQLQDLIPGACGVVLNVDEESTYPGVNQNPVVEPHSTDRAYLLYTSGSTGRPKGVEVPHRTLQNLISWQVRRSSCKSGDKTLQFASLNFDVAFQELFSTWASGGTLVIASEKVRHNLNLLGDLLEREAVVRIFLPFRVLDTWSGLFRPKGSKLKLKEIITAGEQLKITPAIRGLFSNLDRAKLVNQYGPTETHVVTSYSLSGDVDDWPVSPPIGKPIANSRIYILDESQNPVPIGISGEIYIGGDNVSLGYLNQAELTARSFISAPWNAEEIIYRTGDLGRYRKDGNIEFIGRLDSQVKIRGFRIELGEIETCLAYHDRVRACVVSARNDHSGDAFLVAYVVERDPMGVLCQHELEEYLRQTLPDYMIPGEFIFLEALPLLPNGKTDLASLPEPNVHKRTNGIYVAPRNLVEESLSRIWSNLLQVEQVGIKDDFFNLGGHSLRAMQLISRIQDSLNCEISLPQLFENPTIEELAKIIGSRTKEAAGAVAPLVGEEPVGPITLSPFQQQIWFLDRLQGSSAEYNLGEVLKIKGKLDGQALEQSLNSIIQRHQSLRASFIDAGGVPNQIFSPDAKIAINREDVSWMEEADRDAQVASVIKREFQMPFDLSQGPLIRSRLLRLGERDYVLTVLFHHMVFDGWSMEVFRKELSAHYDHFVDGSKLELANVSYQYSDYIKSQKQFQEEGCLAGLEDYWIQKLSGAPPLLTLPIDGQRKPERISGTGTQFLNISKSLSTAFDTFCLREGSTQFIGLLAVFRLLLSRLSGQEDVVIGCPVAGRTESLVENLIGAFVGTLALRTDLSGTPTFSEFLQREKITVMDAFDHQKMPFEKIVEKLQPDRSLLHLPIFQVFLNYANYQREPMRLSGLKVEKLELETSNAKFDITLYVSEVDGCMRLKAVYNEDLFFPDSIRHFLFQFHYLVEQVIEDASLPITAYSLVTPEAREILPDPAASIEAPDPLPVTVQFLSHVSLSPEAVAVRSPDGEWNYQQLANHSRRLKEKLLEDGIQAGDVVAICGSSCYALIAAILAVLRARCTLLLIDSGLPAARRELMLKGASVRYWIGVGTAENEPKEWGGLLESIPSVHISESGDFSDACVIGEGFEGEACEPEPKDAAYVFFTSGSTGTPKAVLGNHKGLSHFIDWEKSELDLKSADRVAQLTGLSFDVILRDIFLPLTSGASLCIPDLHDKVHGEAVISWLRRNAVTVVHSVPSVVHAWLDGMDSSSALPQLRWLLMAGEPLTDELIHMWRSRIGNTNKIINLYGTTETTLAKSYYLVPENPEPGVQSIGRPLPNTQFLILDQTDSQCGIGEPGEIVIRTPFHTEGYLNDSSLSNVGFTGNPFTDNPDDLVYHTGDYGAYTSSGRLKIYGRKDEQVKIRGIRIEPGEIASILAGHEKVKRCAVVAHEDETGVKRLVAYVVPVDNGLEPSLGSLRQLAKQFLSEYMVPSSLVILEEIPLTPTGKIDKKSLPKPQFGRAQIDEEYMEAGSPVETALADIWKKVLKVDKVGVHDNFFQLGGHSLLATQVVSRLQSQRGIKLPLKRFFETPTIAGLADHLSETQITESGFPKQSVSGRYLQCAPLSFSQQRLWFLDRLEGSSAEYNMSGVLDLRGHLDSDALEKAINAIVARHASLRTRFVGREGEPRQQIEPFLHITVRKVDLCTLSPGDSKRALEAETLKEQSEVFDLEKGPLFRAAVLKLGDSESRFVWAVHHIVFDGWSKGVFHAELERCYQAYLNGVDPQLESLTMQYPDFALAQRQMFEGSALDSHLAYWRKQLAGVASMELPTDRNRPARQAYRGSRHNFEIPASLITRLLEFNKRENLTPFMTMLACFQVLLARYCGQEDIVVGIPIANRQDPELEKLIGFFVNNLVLRLDLSGKPDFSEVVSRVRKMALNAFQYQDMSFEKLVEELNPKRDLSRHPLFQVAFAFHNTPNHLPALEGLKVHIPDTVSTTTHFDLTLNVRTMGNTWKGSISYSTDLFDAETIQRMEKHYLTLLSNLLDNPNLPFTEAPLLTAVEESRLLTDFNDTEKDFPWDKCLQELIEQQVAETPGAIALVFNGEQLTYQELNARANQLAHHLRSLGVGPEVAVGICLERSPEMVIGLLAILKAGGAYVPLDPHFPENRLSLILEDAAIKALITERSFEKLFKSYNGPIIRLEEDMKGGPEGNPPVLTNPENSAYVIFTSGSTGRPKGVVIEHRSVVNFLTSIIQYPGINSSDTILAVTTISFDISILELFGPLLVGAKIVLMPDSMRSDVEQLMLLMEDSGATVMGATPATWKLLLLSSWEGNDQLKVFSGGDALSTDLAAKLIPRCNELWNCYGPTETTVYSTVARIKDPGDISIGVPISNTRVYIVDGNGQLVPQGIPGELLIGGVGVAREYLNQAAKTAERFIVDSFSEISGQRLYRTGDLCRWRADGRIDYLGRIDNQVKLRGFRVELGEIEGCAKSYPGISDSAAIVWKDKNDNERLFVYLVLDNQAAPPQKSAFFRYLGERLPDYMVPSDFMALEKLPLTPNGKIDKRGLPEPDFRREGPDQSFVEAKTKGGKQLAAIWREVLGIDKVGVNDNFFEVGGHSLLAAQVAARIRERLDLNITLRQMFETPTIAGLLEAAGTETEGSESRLKVGLNESDDLSSSAPLSFSQQRLWFLDRLEGSSVEYHIAPTFVFHGKLDYQVFNKALNTIVERHDSLRTYFEEVAGSPVQKVRSFLSVEATVRYFDTLEAGMRETAVLNAIQEEKLKPFDLSRGPLFRVTLLKKNSDEHLFVPIFHHIISDGWSLGLFFNELTLLYRAYLSGQSNPLEPLPLQYPEFSIRQRAALQGERIQELLDYWRTQLSGIKVLALSTDHARPARQSYRGGKYDFSLSASLFERLKAFNKKERITLFMGLLGAFKVLLSRYTGQDDIVIGSPFANRTEYDQEQLIGFFVNSMVLRTDLSGDPTFRELLMRVRETSLDAYQHHELPFDKLVEELNPVRDLSRHPLFQVSFAFQNVPDSQLALEGLEVTPYRIAASTTHFDLSLYIAEKNGSLNCSLSYSSDLFEAQTIERMAGHFLILIGNLLEAPDRPVGQVSILSGEERKLLLETWNDTLEEYPEDRCVFELIEAQVARRPDEIALHCEGKTLTYQELNERANWLALHLRELKVGPESRVGIYLERSTEMLVALLAVLKAGGAYVPLDPQLPEGRLSWIAEDSGIAVLLSQHSLPGSHKIFEGAVVWMETWMDKVHAENPAKLTSPGNSAYVIYTSGSTGKPKGTVIEHRSVVNMLSSASKRPGINESDVLLAVGAYSFDISVFELFTPLCNGGRVVILPDSMRADGLQIARLINDLKVTVMFATPSFWRLLLLSGWKGNPNLKALAGGEALTSNLAEELLPQCGQLWNLYGPTEATVFSLCQRIQKADTITLGRPIGNTEIYIVDRQNQLAPAGVPGELLLGGPGLAREYLNLPELTQECFIENPFSGQRSKRLYRTGDLCKWHPDGTVLFLGRMDKQVKILGYRVELTEIEVNTTLHPSVRDCVAIAKMDPLGDTHVIAYVVAATDTGIPPAKDLVEFLGKKLPEYMIPKAFVTLDALPLNSNGKVDYAKLPAVEERIEVSADPDIDRKPSAVEQKLIDVWAEVLGFSDFGIHDDFFDLGGHSLLATQIVARIREDFNCDFPLRKLFDAPTVAQLAKEVESIASTEDTG